MKEENIEPVSFRGKRIGHIYHKKGVYMSPRNRTHAFRKFGDGFGVSENLLDYLGKCGVEVIVINYEGRKEFIATVNDFIVNGEDWDEEGDKQLILPLKYFRKEIKQEIQGRLE